MFHTVRPVVRAADANTCYVLSFAREGLDTRLGPLPEYVIRAELARLGFGASEIDGRIDRASMETEPGDAHPGEHRLGGPVVVTLGP